MGHLPITIEDIGLRAAKTHDLKTVTFPDDDIVTWTIGCGDNDAIDEPGAAKPLDNASQHALAVQTHQHFAWQACASHASLHNGGDPHASPLSLGNTAFRRRRNIASIRSEERRVGKERGD